MPYSNPFGTNHKKFTDLPVISAILAALSVTTYLVYSLLHPKSKTQDNTNTSSRPLNFLASSLPYLSSGLILSYLFTRRFKKTPAKVDADETLRQARVLSEEKAKSLVSPSSMAPLLVPTIPSQILAVRSPPPTATSPTPLNRFRNQLETETLTDGYRESIPIRRIWVVGLPLICLGILAIAIYILNVSLWNNKPLPVPASVERWACFIPQFCNLRFPPDTLLAFIGILLVVVLFGWHVSRLPDPSGLTDIQSQPITFKNRRLIFNGWHWLIIGLCVIISAYIIWGSFNNKPIPVWIWFISLVSFVGVAGYLAPAKNDWSVHTRWNLIYLVGIASLLIGLTGFLTSRPIPLILGGGVAILGLGSVFARHWRHWSVPERTERVLLLLITLAAFGLMIYGSRQWNWSVSEDAPSPWDYYEQAMEYATGILPWPNANSTGVYGGTAALSSAYQAVCMVVFGVDAFAWRVSNFLLLALATPAFYYFSRQFMSRRGGILTICLYASGHYLLSYSKTGYHTLQIIAVFAFTLAALAWATRHGSLLGFALAGLFLGLGFNTYGVARIYVWAAAMWLVFYCFPLDLQARRIKWDRLAIWGVLGFTFMLTVLPISANPVSWQEQLSRTVFVQSDIAHNSIERLFQIATNVLYGSTSFLTSSANTDFVFGAHVDPISAGLIVLALASLIAGWKNLRRARLFFLSLIGGLIVFVSGLETYSYPAINWMVALTPLYALLAALGLIYLGHIIQLSVRGISHLHWIRTTTSTVISMTLSLGIIAPLNFWISNDLGPRKLSQPPQSFIIQSAMLTQDQTGNGARVIAIIDVTDQLFYLTDQLRPLLPMMYQAYHIPLERLTIISPLDAYNDPSFCNVGSQPAVIIMDISNKYALPITNRIQECWPDSTGHALIDMTNRLYYYRFINSKAQELIRSLPGYWYESPLPRASVQNLELGSRNIWEVKKPLGIATSPDGDVAVIEGATLGVTIFNNQGQAIKSLTGLFLYPSAVGYTANNTLLVLDAGAQTPLMWFNADFQVIQQGSNLNSARGMFVAPDDSVYVADTGVQRIVHLSPTGEMIGEYLAPGRFGQPTSVAVSPSGWVAVGDPVIGKIFILDQAGVIQAEHSISPGDTTVDKPGLLWISNDTLLFTDPGAGRIILAQGQKILQEWTGFFRPNGLAMGQNNQVLVLEYDKNRITTIQLPK